MTTNQSSTEKEVKPVSVPVIMESKEKPVDRKTELLAKKAKNHNSLPPAEQKELEEILAKEVRERRRGAFIHKLRERAEHYGRKAAVTITKEVTDMVADFSKRKAEQTESIWAEYRSVAKVLEKQLKQQMQELQETYNRAVASAAKIKDDALGEINQRYRTICDEREAEMNQRMSEIGSVVDDFSAILDALTLEELEELEKTGRTKMVGEEHGKDVVVILPGS